MKKVFQSKIVLVVITAFVLIISCTNEFDYGKLINAVKTVEFSNITQTTASVSGNVITDNGSNITERGICYGTNSNPTISGLKKIFDMQENFYLGFYTCTLDNLSPNTRYYARAYATNSYGTAYGTSVTFTTLQATVPIISSTTAASLITATTASTGGTISNSGASNITSRGVCYSSTVSTPTIANTITNNGTGIGTFISSLTGLTANTTYYIRAYATNGLGTAYGDVKSFSTSTATLPVGITTTAASTVTQTTASSGGNINNDGGATITSRGVCWSSSTSSPTIANTRTLNGSGIGNYISNITGLTAGTTYYVRAYATNAVGTSYGSAVSFTTNPYTLASGITTNTITSVLQNSAISGGNISLDGGTAITARGVCWSSTSSSPTISNPKTVDGTGIGSFVSNISGLLPNTTYYVRAYATNSVGTAYGNFKTFTTSGGFIPSGITTTSISGVINNIATSGGSINSDGGSPITSKGVCWSSTTNAPTILNSITNNGTGITSFSSTITGLTANTTYFVRAYATNAIGTAYGNTLSFITSPTSLTVGQSYQGGVIAYIFVSGDSGYVSGQTHGLIATISNQSTGALWGCSGTSITGTSTALGAGLTNTSAIVNICVSSTSAAALCYNLTSGGYSDWYLPSYIELQKLYINKTAIGGFTNSSYWSSTQNSSTRAYSFDFLNGTGNTSTAKTIAYSVRAIRQF